MIPRFLYRMRYVLLFAIFSTAFAAGCSDDEPLVESVNLAVPGRPVTNVAIIGDYGTASVNTSAVATMVKSFDPEAILTLGDNSYPEFRLDNVQANIADHYCDYIYNPGAPENLRCDGNAAAERQNRFFPTTGNHDYGGRGDLDDYLAYFDLPGNERYYSVRVGTAEFFFVDSHAPLTYPEQQAWLAEATAASGAIFKIAVLHHSPYSVGNHGDNPRVQWDFAAYGIQVVLTGHDHDYQRFEVDDVTYIVNGVGGAPIRNDCGHQSSRAGSPIFCQGAEYGALLASASDEEFRLEFRTVTQGYPTKDVVVVRP